LRGEVFDACFGEFVACQHKYLDWEIVGDDEIDEALQIVVG
jgi:hypothetical protein